LNASVEASEPHDFAVRFTAIRQRRIRVHRIPPHVRDDRETPLCWDGMAMDLDLIWVSGEAENFLKWDWTRGIMLNRFNKFRFARKPQGRVVSQSG
jgi:hypothetical protein